MERADGVRWKPRRVCPVTPVSCIMFNSRFQCKKCILAYTAFLGLEPAINILRHCIACFHDVPEKKCAALLRIACKPSSGLGKLNKFNEHLNSFFGKNFPPPRIRRLGVAGKAPPRHILRTRSRNCFLTILMKIVI